MKDLFNIILLVYIISLIMLSGMSIPKWKDELATCENRLRHVDYIFPAKQIGCWLGR